MKRKAHRCGHCWVSGNRCRKKTKHPSRLCFQHRHGAVTKAQRVAWRELCTEAPLMMQRLDSSGLHKTARAMDAVVKAIGWEVAEKLDRADRRRV